MKKTILFFCCIALAFGCTDMELQYNDDEAEVSRSSSTVIPLDKALANLDRQIETIFGPGTKASTKCYDMSSVVTAGGRDILGPSTRSASGQNGLPDTLIYIVNFENDNGYAILSADARLDEDIYCITEKGRLTIEDLEQTYAYLSSSSDSSGMEHAIIDFPDPGLPPVIDDIIRDDLDDIRFIEDGEFDVQPGGSKTIIYGPLLKTKWYQRSPFNDCVPDGDPAGCVAIAAAQIILHNRVANNTIFNGYECDWDSMETVCNYKTPYDWGDTTAQQQVANFVFEIGKDYNCNIDYGKKGSSGFINGIKRTFENFGYSNVEKSIGLDNKVQDKIFECLSQGYPVPVTGADGFSGHAWVIDGIFNHYYHINWGWNGKSDGYYKIGIFNTEERKFIDKEYDSGASVNEDDQSNFNCLYKVVTYSL